MAAPPEGDGSSADASLLLDEAEQIRLAEQQAALIRAYAENADAVCDAPTSIHVAARPAVPAYDELGQPLVKVHAPDNLFQAVKPLIRNAILIRASSVKPPILISERMD